MPPIFIFTFAKAVHDWIMLYQALIPDGPEKDRLLELQKEAERIGQMFN